MSVTALAIRMELAGDETTPPRQALTEAFRKGCSCGEGDFTVSGGLSFDLASIELEEPD